MSVERWNNFNDRDLELVYLSLYYWRKEVQGSISKGDFSEKVIEKNKEFIGELGNLIHQIQVQRCRRKIYESH